MIHAILIAFNNTHQTCKRWVRDMLPGLQQYGHDFRVTCIDNSQDLTDTVLQDTFGANHYWQNGENLQYGPSINLAVTMFPSDYVLYCCSRHGFAVDPSWVADIMNPLVNDETVGMTGHLRGSNSPEGVAHATGQDWIKDKFRFIDDAGNGYVPQHVQGGVFAARTKLLTDHPYPVQLPHMYTDHMITWAALKAGYKCVDVPTIVSVWRDVIYQRAGLKYLHDESPDCTR